MSDRLIALGRFCMLLQETVLDVENGDFEGETILTGPSSTETEYDPDDVLSVDLQRAIDHLHVATPPCDRESLSGTDTKDTIECTFAAGSASPLPSRQSGTGELSLSKALNSLYLSLIHYI